jgi:Secretion system C-terminal sorting domain
MKTKIYLLFLSLYLALNLAAQVSPLDGKYSTLVIEEWTKGQWINSTKMTNTFDSSGNKIKDENDSWNDTTKVWKGYMVNAHTLNANSTINFTISQMWNDQTKSWDDLQKTFYTYDASKNILTQKTQMFFGANWLDYAATINTYNGSGKLSQSVEQTFDFMTFQLVNSSQQTYSYNADGVQNQSVSQKWNTTTSAWENNARTTNTYNDSKKIIVMIDEIYSSSAWVNDSKTMISYNADGSMKEILYQNWNASGGNWVDKDKETFTNNPDGTTGLVITTTWNPATSIWENQTRITFTYGLTSTGQQLAGTDQVKVFPNPFTNVISVEYNPLNVSNIQLYNVDGQLVRIFEKGELLSKINLGSLKNGVYFLKAVSPDSQQVIKLLKSK